MLILCKDTRSGECSLVGLRREMEWVDGRSLGMGLMMLGYGLGRKLLLLWIYGNKSRRNTIGSNKISGESVAVISKCKQVNKHKLIRCIDILNCYNNRHKAYYRTAYKQYQHKHHTYHKTNYNNQ